MQSLLCWQVAADWCVFRVCAVPQLVQAPTLRFNRWVWQEQDLQHTSHTSLPWLWHVDLAHCQQQAHSDGRAMQDEQSYGRWREICRPF